MAIQDISIRLKMAATGVKEQVDSSEQIADNYARANANAQRLAATQARAGQQSGGQQARAAAMANSRTTAEMIDYDKAGGITGRGGAQARDFANQAQGLGGLVRLYAITAANVYALTEAFGALSRALDTTNMVKGLDTLGAASGRALGTLSKQLAQVSDGAISMREAMQATAMSSSAGMTNQQILRMGEIAKNASLALGVSMPDAINRLSRGIVKLEPELLDELGIFTKIEPAVQAYALQLGKSVASLTDFERRQAFANAVLKEGEDKFSAINGEINSNSFDKLAASLKNVAQTGLELINTVLAPIAELLSKSPAALAGGLVLLASTLVKRALPALTQIREGLDAERKAAQALVAKKKEDTVAAGAALGQLAFNKVKADMEANAESELRIFERKEAKLNELKQQGLTYSKQLNELMKKDIYDISQSEVDAAKQAARDRLKAAKDAHKELIFLQKQGFTVSAQDMGKAKSERLAAQSEYGAVTALDRTVKAEQDFVNAQKTLINQYKEKLQLTDQFKSLVAAEEKMVISAKRSEVLANMAYNTSLIGIRDAYRLMVAEAEAAGNIGNLATLKLKAIAVGIGSIITSALGAVGTIIQVITGLIAGFGLLDAALSKNSKETQQFNDAIGNSESSINAARKAIELYEKRNEDSIKSTVAMANAFGELADSMEVSIKRFDKMEQSAGTWDNITNFVKGLFGFGREDALAESLRKQLDSALDVAEKFGQRGQLDEQLKSYLNVENMLDKNAVEKALKGLDSSARAGLQEILGTFKSRFQEIAGTLDGFRENLDKTYKSFQQFMQSMALTDPLAKLSASFGQLAISMIDVATMSAGDIKKAFEELAKSPEKLAMFSPGTIKEFFKIKDLFIIEKEQVDAYESAIDKMSRKLNEFKQVQADAASSDIFDTKSAAIGAGVGAVAGGVAGSILLPGLGTAGGIAAGSYVGTVIGGVIGAGVGVFDKVSKNITAYFTKTEADSLQANVDAFKQIQSEIQTTFKEAAEFFAKASEEALDKASKLSGMAIENSAIRAGNTIASAYATILTGPQAVAEQARIAKSEQSINIRNAKIAVDMIDQQDSLTTAIRENTAAVELNTQSRLPDSAAKTERIAKIEKGRQIASLTEQMQDMSPKDRAAMFGELSGVDPAIIRAAAARAAIRDQAKDQARAKLREEQAKASAIDIKAGIETKAADLAQTKQLQDLENNIKQLGLQRLDIQTQILGVTTEQTINAKFAEQATIREKNNQAEIADIKFKQEETEKGLAAAKEAKQIASYKSQLEFLKKLKASVEDRQKAEGNLEELRKRQELLNKELDTIRKQFELRKSNQDVVFAASEAALEIERANATARAEVLGYDKQHTTEILYQLDLERNRLADERSRFDITQRYNQQFEEASKKQKAADQTTEDLQKEIAKEQERIIKLRDNELAKLDTQINKQNELLRIGKEQTLELEKQRLIQEQRTRQQALADARFEAESATNIFSPTYTAQRAYQNTLRRGGGGEGGDPEIIRRQDALVAQNVELQKVKNQILEIEAAGDMAGADILKRQQDLEATQKRMSDSLQAELTNRREIAKTTLEAAEYQAKMAEEAERTNRAADSLKGSMGGTGDRLADIANSMLKFAQGQETSAKSMKTLADQTKAAKDQATGLGELGLNNQDVEDQIDKARAGQKEQAKMSKKFTAEELANQQNLAASTKMLFKEKTGAYKTFHAIEKTIHAARIAMAVVQMATDLKTLLVGQTVEAGKTASVNAGVLSRLGAYAADIYGKTIGQLGPIAGPIVATGLIATMFAYLGKSSSNKASTVGITAEDMNQVAGTGQQYVNGQLVNREGGVLGNPTEMADSITSSIDILSNNLFGIFNDDNSKIIKKLEGVKNNTEQTVKALLGQITGYAGQVTSPFGTMQGTIKKDDPWWRWGPLKSTSTSTQVLSSGIKVQGALGDLINETGNTLFQSWENVLVTVKKKFFGVTYDDDSFVDPKYGPLDETFKRSLIKSLQAFNDAIIETATTLEGDATRAANIIKTFPFLINTNLKDLNATDALNKFRGDLSIELNKALKAIYPWIDEFKKTGEETGETLARLASDGSNLRYGLSLLGVQFKETDLYLRTLIEQDFIDKFGGLDKFGEAMNYYIDNFLDVNTRYTKDFASLTRVFNENNLQVPATKDAYAKLVDSLKVQAETNEDARNKLAKLIVYSEAYNEILDQRLSIEKSLDDLNEQLSDFENNVTDLEKALRAIVKGGFEYYDTLKKLGVATQENITKIMKLNKFQALQKIDEQIKTLYETRRNEINKTIDSLKAAKDKIVELKNSLLLGTESILTPYEKFMRLSSEYTKTLEAAKKGDQAAINKFPQLTQSLLGAGREMYSSSSRYTSLFETVMKDIDSLDISLTDQLTDAERQLAELEDQTEFLEKIDSSTRTTAEKLQELLTLRSKVAAIDPEKRAKQLIEAEKLGINRNDPEYFNKGQQSLDAKARILELEGIANRNIAAKELELAATRQKARAAQDKKLVAQGDPTIKQIFAKAFLGRSYATVTQEEINVKIPDNDPALLAWVQSVNDQILQERSVALTAADAALADFNKAKTERDKITAAKNEADLATTLEGVLGAKDKAVTAAAQVDQLLASATNNIAEANRLLEKFQQMLDRYLLEWAMKTAQYFAEKYAREAGKGDYEVRSVMKPRVEGKITELGKDISDTNAYIQWLITEGAPQNIIDWATGIKESLVADKGLADSWFSKAETELVTTMTAILNASDASMKAKSATTVAEAEAFAEKAQAQSVIAQAALANAYQYLTMSEFYADKGLKTFKDASDEAKTKVITREVPVDVGKKLIDDSIKLIDQVVTVVVGGVVGGVTAKIDDVLDIDVSRTLVDPGLVLNDKLDIVLDDVITEIIDSLEINVSDKAGSFEIKATDSEGNVTTNSSVTGDRANSGIPEGSTIDDLLYGEDLSEVVDEVLASLADRITEGTIDDLTGKTTAEDLNFGVDSLDAAAGASSTLTTALEDSTVTILASGDAFDQAATAASNLTSILNETARDFDQGLNLDTSVTDSSANPGQGDWDSEIIGRGLSGVTASTDILAENIGSLSEAVSDLDSYVGDSTIVSGDAPIDNLSSDTLFTPDSGSTSLVDNAASLAEMIVADRVSTYTAVTDALGLNTISQGITTVGEGAISVINAVKDAVNSISTTINNILSNETLDYQQKIEEINQQLPNTSRQEISDAMGIDIQVVNDYLNGTLSSTQAVVTRSLEDINGTVMGIVENASLTYEEKINAINTQLADVSREQLAEATGISLDIVNNFLNGTFTPAIDVVTADLGTAAIDQTNASSNLILAATDQTNAASNLDTAASNLSSAAGQWTDLYTYVQANGTVIQSNVSDADISRITQSIAPDANAAWNDILDETIGTLGTLNNSPDIYNPFDVSDPFDFTDFITPSSVYGSSSSTSTWSPPAVDTTWNSGYSYYMAPTIDSGYYGISSFWDYSDARLKKNIEFAKTLSNGINLYDFNYKQPLDKIYGTDSKRGVLAQEIEKDYPNAVLETAMGLKMVDYSKLPINLSEVEFRALGGPVNSNSPYIVGEVGPELFVPRTNGTIIPNNKLGTDSDDVSNQEIVDAINRLTQVVAQSNMENAKVIADSWSKNQWRGKLNTTA